MRYNQRATFEDGTVLPVNLSGMGIEMQNLVFGDAKKDYVIARFRPPIATRKGWFSVDGKKYMIQRNVSTERVTSLYGSEYHG